MRTPPSEGPYPFALLTVSGPSPFRRDPDAEQRSPSIPGAPADTSATVWNTDTTGQEAPTDSRTATSEAPDSSGFVPPSAGPTNGQSRAS